MIIKQPVQFFETIIVGAGPAGSACAWKLKQAGRQVLLLDKASFPRVKLCAGWITSKVMQDLEFTPADYPHALLDLDLTIHLPVMQRGFRWFPTSRRDYSIRRVEFDAWLLERSGVECRQHQVRNIVDAGADGFVIDDQFRCRYLVGAGGTGCPVGKQFFASTRDKRKQIVTLENEFHYPSRSDQCHLFFFRHGLPGYAWYVPKGDGYVNIGVGGLARFLKGRHARNIHQHWRLLMDDLVALQLLDHATASDLQASGHPYYLNSLSGDLCRGNCQIIGDAAGLASIDLGEGIGPAIESALLAAQYILQQHPYQRAVIDRYSLQSWPAKLLSTVPKLGALRRF